MTYPVRGVHYHRPAHIGSNLKLLGAVIPQPLCRGYHLHRAALAHGSPYLYTGTPTWDSAWLNFNWPLAFYATA